MKYASIILALFTLSGCDDYSFSSEKFNSCMKNIPSGLDKDIAIATGRCKVPTYLQFLIMENLK